METDRPLLRRLQRSDLEPLLSYRNDPEVTRYQSWERYGEEEARGLILGREEPFAPGRWFQLAVEDKRTGTLLGDLGIRVEGDGRQAEVGYTFAREHWGKGYASEAVACLLDHAFRNPGLHRVYAVTDKENRASFVLLERLGLRREGAFVQNA